MIETQKFSIIMLQRTHFEINTTIKALLMFKRKLGDNRSVSTYCSSSSLLLLKVAFLLGIYKSSASGWFDILCFRWRTETNLVGTCHWCEKIYKTLLAHGKMENPILMDLRFYNVFLLARMRVSDISVIEHDGLLHRT